LIDWEPILSLLIWNTTTPKQKELSEYKTNMVNIKQYASDLQTFLALKQIGSDVEAQDTCLHALVNIDSLKQTKISCNIDIIGVGSYLILPNLE
jgi:hypothetical protein